MAFGLHDILQIGALLIALALLTPPLGSYMAKVLSGERNFLTPVFGKPERLIYRICGVAPEKGMDWKSYLFAILAFSVVGFIVLFLMLLLQAYMPWNPQHMGGVSLALAFNTAVSFVTNTNWQSYAGETTMSYFVQMVGLTVHNFLSAATGIAVLMGLIRGLTRKSVTGIGNFWADLVRSTLYILMPLSIILALILIAQGSVQTLSPYVHATTVQGQEQVIPLGPAASQIAIKQLGTNGGGFFNANSAHPFENPTPLTDFFEMLSILLIGSSLVYTYGKMIGSLRQAFVIWSVMMSLFVAMLSLSLYSEFEFHPAYVHQPSMEGIETRFGITNSAMWEVATTATSNGSVNSMQDSLMPLSGMVALVDMMFGEVIIGGVGSGLYGMLLFVILTVFISGLMVGRTPEYLGKKIETYEVKMAVIGVLAPGLVVLILTAIASVTKAGVTGLGNSGPHGFSEILYAFTSPANNNGSAFAGIDTNTIFYSLTQGFAMIVGRFGVIVPVLAISGSLAGKKTIPPSPGTFPTDSALFGILLAGVVVIVAALTFFPALALGPVVEHFLMLSGKTF